MAESSDTTTLVVVAAVVAVAVMYSRRGPMGYGYGSGSGSSTSGRRGDLTQKDVLDAAKDLFSGLLGAYKSTHSSDPNNVDPGFRTEPTKTSTQTSYSDSSGGCGVPGTPPCGDEIDTEAYYLAGTYGNG